MAKTATAKEKDIVKLAMAVGNWGNVAPNPWTPADIDKLDSKNIDKEYQEITKYCRFFYRKDPLASTAVNRLSEIGINDLIFGGKSVNQNTLRIYYGIKDKLLDFSMSMAAEFLISGLVVPEVTYTAVAKDELEELGIKKHDGLLLPTSLWIRDPSTIYIKASMLGDMPSYFVKVPEKIRIFIQGAGIYDDGKEDKALYNQLLARYPKFVAEVKAGKEFVLLNNPYILRRKPQPDSPYPTPYLYAAIEPLKHKRNLRRLDYSLAARAIAAMLQVKMGSDEFPVTEDDSDRVESLKGQMYWRENQTQLDIERVFQIFTDHTVSFEWIIPPLEVLLSEHKYAEVNEDIITALGFPGILLTGEARKSNTSNPELATLAPVKVMEDFRRRILVILRAVLNEVHTQNKLEGKAPSVRFAPINMHDFQAFITGMTKLYDIQAVSKKTFAEAFGYDYETEAVKIKEELDLAKEMGLPDIGAQPFSNKPVIPGQKTPVKKPNNAQSSEEEDEE